MENQKKINQSIRRKVVIPINKGLAKNIFLMDSCNSIKHRETKDLLYQAYITIQNSEKIVANSIVDSCSLLRCALEYLMIAINIQYDDATYNELINLSLQNDKRDKTKDRSMVDEFRKHLNDISEYWFAGINREDKKIMLEDFYNKMCYFTHASLLVTSYSKFKKEHIREIYILLCKINIYTLKFLLLLSLQFFTNNRGHFIKFGNLYMSYFFTYMHISELGKNINDFSDIKYSMHTDQNIEYINKNIKEGQELKDTFSSFDNTDLETMLKDFLT